MILDNIAVFSTKIPLKKPFITSVRQTEVIEDILVRIRSDELEGWGNACVIPVITGTEKEAIVKDLEKLSKILLGDIEKDFNGIISGIYREKVSNVALAAMDIALHDIFSRKAGLPLAEFLGGSVRPFPICATISLLSPDEMAEDALKLRSEGFSLLKLKVGGNPDLDFARINSVHKAVGEKVSLFIDVNQGWNLDDALSVIKRLSDAGIVPTGIEQPLEFSNYRGMETLKAATSISIFADESANSLSMAMKIITERISSGINVKLQKYGGLRAASIITDWSELSGFKSMAGCMMESPVGVWAMAHLVASRNSFVLCDLDPLVMIRDNPVCSGSQCRAGQMEISRDHGLGISSIDDIKMIKEYWR
ncbi:dipeptide epimerase [Myxococcota bacterium]|nr:dipeptide epimerase [Myxococcota bacterium]MBU1381116.1 dipeptide epimerase [Myxococcota bacterium]MBU1496237.1 dipeptide epimerase [Myxococcota bacterium]